MQRRNYLKLLGSAVGGVSLGTSVATAADTQLEPGTWYDATVEKTIDGDTFDVKLTSDGTVYNVRVLGIDTPEKSGNTRYDKLEEWEGIEDSAYLETWGNNASDFAKGELPVGTNCQIAVDSESEELDIYGRLLAKIRYDRTADGSMNTVYNKYTIEQGYARVYSASMTNTDAYWDAENAARASGLNVWSQSDPSSTPEVRDNDVGQTFHPNTTSIKTTAGQLADSRTPIWAESTATQSQSSGAVTYSSNIPLVGVDAANNLAMLGGQPIQEDHDSVSDHLEHFVFVTNLIDSLTEGTRSGMVLVDGGHHQFGADHSCSAEDTVFYQRYLEGQGIELAGINTLGDSTGPSLSNARAIIITSPEDTVSSADVSAITSFIDNGGAVILMGSAASTSAQQSNLNSLAADLGTDLRLNEDEITDSENNVGSDTLVTSAHLNTTDFSLWSAYSGSGASPSYLLSIDDVVRNVDSLNEETVVLSNDGSNAIDMSGWTMTNGDGDTYSFPSGFTLAAGDSVTVHTGSGSDTATDLYWGASMFRWDVSADTCTVYDADGDIAQDTSWSVPNLTIPTISEDGATLNDEYVEVRNENGGSVDLSGFELADAVDTTYTFPSGVTLADGATVRVHTGSGSDSSTDLYWGRGSAVWNNGGDTATLTTAGGDVVREHTYPAPYSLSIPTINEDGDETTEYVDIRNDGSSILDCSGFTLEDAAGNDYTFPDSFALDAGATVRVHTGSGTDSTTDLYWGRGGGVWNNGGDSAYVYDDNGRLAVSQSTSGDGCSSKICIQEIQADGATLNDEYVDFTNTGSTDQDMTGWTVEDEVGKTYSFPSGYTITSDGSCRLHTGSGTDSSQDGDLYWGRGSPVWNNSGDTVHLYEADGSLHTQDSY
ncbi:lamin tail domain-containing protein [Haladaptatus sp. ZSTT2]|uniref:lamin tail domain-containing protein n=1 Tax=Haladaptatus sp. ZSTT2 TaxID=3120515 RepID=UPI00300F1935